VVLHAAVIEHTGLRHVTVQHLVWTNLTGDVMVCVWCIPGNSTCCSG